MRLNCIVILYSYPYNYVFPSLTSAIPFNYSKYIYYCQVFISLSLIMVIYYNFEVRLIEYIRIMRDLREDADKTQQQIADYLGTSQTMYARYERGANELPIRHLIKLCELYHVSADYFLGIKHNKQ